MADGEQGAEHVAKFSVGEQVIVFATEAQFQRRLPFGTVEGVTWHTNTALVPSVTYAVYRVRMEDGLNPNPIDVTEMHIDRYVEMAVTAAQEAAGQ